MNQGTLEPVADTEDTADAATAAGHSGKASNPPAPGAGRKHHIGIAEHGKVLALAGDHKGALRHYREAMAQTVRAADPEVFFRHYLECSIESLELMHAYDEVLAYCERAIEHYGQHATTPELEALAQRDLAHVYQRQGVVLLKQGHKAEARTAFQHALRLQPGAMPLASSLLHWIDRNLHGDAARILAEQRRHGYFSVRSDTVDRSRAVAVPLPATGF